MVRYFSGAAVILVGFLVVAGSAVEIQVPGDYATIQAAVDAAENGDEVIVSKGTYQGEGNRDINFSGKAITLRSADGPEQCILDCGGSEADPHRAFLFVAGEDQNSVVDGFAITQGYQSQGGAIYCSNSSPTIQNCHFLDNSCDQYGGAIRCFDNGNPTISHCLFQNNSSGARGAGIFCSTSNPAIRYCTFTDNTTTSYGGGIGCFVASPEISYCSFAENSALQGGGIICEDNSDPNIRYCTFTGNVVNHFGGGLSVRDNCDVLIQGCKISGNVAGDYGGGIFSTRGTLTVQNSLITGNYSQSYGGGICCYESTAAIQNCSIVSNRADSPGGGVSSRWLSNITLTNSIVWDNISYHEGNQISVTNFTGPSTLTVSYCDIQGGQAEAQVLENNTLNWGTGNRDVEPEFVSPDYWDDNQTPGDVSDDIWIRGCWYLLPDSDCIDTADNAPIETGATDLAGRNRILNGIVDMGAYENDPHDLDVDKITVKAGKTRQAQKDSFTVSGSLDALEADFLAVDYITLRCGAWGETVSSAAFKPAGKNPKYIYKAPTGGITKMTLDFGQQNFSASGKNLDMSGTIAPAPVALLLGDSYYGYVTAEDQGVNDIINGKKSLPVQLLVGHEDYLYATKAKAKQGKTNNVGNLTVQGLLAVDELVDLRTQGLTTHWGAGQYVLQGGDFTAKGTNKYIGKVKPSGGDNSSATVTVDFNKCTFKVTLKNTDMAWQSSLVNFGLEFEGFNEQENVEF